MNNNDVIITEEINSRTQYYELPLSNWQILGKRNVNSLVCFNSVFIRTVGNRPTEEELLKFLGTAASMSRQSDSDDFEACKKRVLFCIKKGHHSVLEHANFSFIINCDRGTSHAIVRHRHCAFTQSSTVYGNINGDVNVVSLPIEDPVTGEKVQPIEQEEIEFFEQQAKNYKKLQETLWGERSRDYLPTSYQTQLFMTTNLREWIYFIQRRKDPTTSVRIHVIAVLLEKFFMENYPTIYSAMQEWYNNHPL